MDQQHQQPPQHPHSPQQPAGPHVSVPWPDQQQQQRPHQQFTHDVRAHQPQQHAQQAPQQQYAQPHQQFHYAQQPGMPAQQQQQQQYSPPQGGFVQPGQSSMQQPMGVHDGVIGQPQPFGQPAPMAPGYAQQQLPPGYVQQQQHQQQQQQGAMPQHLAQQPQAYADPRQGFQQQGGMQYGFATPQGVQVFTSNGGAAHAMHYQQQVHAAAAPMHQQPQLQPLAAPVKATVPAMPMRKSRVRTEVIIPIVAVFLLLVAVGVAAANWDEISGNGSEAAATSTTLPPVDDATTGGGAAGDVAAKAEALKMLRLGRYDEASAALAPLLAAGDASPELVKLGALIDARAKRNDALLARVGRQRTAGQFIPALATLKLIEQMHPLSPSLVKLRAQLLAQQRAKTKGNVAAKAFTSANALLVAGRYDEALAVVDAALEAGANKRLSALRADIIRKRAAAASPSGSGSTSGSGSGGAPKSGGQTGGGGGNPSSLPPSAPTQPGAKPVVPDVPNTGGGGAGGVTGHEGMAM